MITFISTGVCMENLSKFKNFVFLLIMLDAIILMSLLTIILLLYLIILYLIIPSGINILYDPEAILTGLCFYSFYFGIYLILLIATHIIFCALIKYYKDIHLNKKDYLSLSIALIIQVLLGTKLILVFT